MTCTLLAFDWSLIGFKALQFILSFSILVTLHELGHYLAAKFFGCRVESFYLFFNPYFSIAAFKKIKNKWRAKFFFKNPPAGEEIVLENGKKGLKKPEPESLSDKDWRKYPQNTEYGLGWLPLGGYVKIAGMIDESMDKAQMKQPAKPWEFRSKPAWQRLIIMLAGVIVNVLLGYFIYSMMLWKWGEEYLPVQEMKYGIAADSLAQKTGFQNGDKIVAVDGKVFEKFSDIPKHLLLRKTNNIEVDRNGSRVHIPIPSDLGKTLIATKNASFITPRLPNVSVKTIIADTMPAAKAGLQPGDKIVSADNVSFNYNDEVRNYIKAHAGQAITLQVLRKNATLTIPLNVSANGSIGVAFDEKALADAYNYKKVNYTLLQAIPGGWHKTVETLSDYWLQLKLIFGGGVKAKDSVGSLITIGSIFPETWDWQRFWSLTGLFSLILAFMNVLPIPALDGGHALFFIYEMITGRKPSDKFMEVAQTVGMVILLGLMVFALSNDVRRFFF